MLRGINRQDIFEEQEDYQQFLIRLQNLVDPIDDNGEHIPSYFHVYAYCLMSNHVHLLLRERTESISISLKRLTVSYAAYYNKRYQRVGHLFQDRFKSEPVNDIEYFVTLLRYVHQNPVKAGICVKAEEYTWSSWQEYLNDDGILPTLCYTRAVLKRITLENLKELVDETLDGDITDVEYTTDDCLTDDDIRQYLRVHWHLEHPTDLQKKEKTDRNEILIEVIRYGAPLRQLSRLTGISYGVIQRINGKIKSSEVGQ
jgi:REP element-mobilizing transposase RayT